MINYCSNCKKKFTDYEEFFYIEQTNNKYCHHCYTLDIFHCYRCDKLVNGEKINHFDYNSFITCDNCLNNYKTNQCFKCEKYFNDKEIIFYNNYICFNCLEDCDCGNTETILVGNCYLCGDSCCIECSETKCEMCSNNICLEHREYCPYCEYKLCKVCLNDHIKNCPNQ